MDIVPMDYEVLISQLADDKDRDVIIREKNMTGYEDGDDIKSGDVDPLSEMCPETCRSVVKSCLDERCTSTAFEKTQEKYEDNIGSRVNTERMTGFDRVLKLRCKESSEDRGLDMGNKRFTSSNISVMSKPESWGNRQGLGTTFVQTGEFKEPKVDLSSGIFSELNNTEDGAIQFTPNEEPYHFVNHLAKNTPGASNLTAEVRDIHSGTFNPVTGLCPFLEEPASCMTSEDDLDLLGSDWKESDGEEDIQGSKGDGILPRAAGPSSAAVNITGGLVTQQVETTCAGHSIVRSDEADSCSSVVLTKSDEIDSGTDHIPISSDLADFTIGHSLIGSYQTDFSLISSGAKELDSSISHAPSGSDEADSCVAMRDFAEPVSENVNRILEHSSTVQKKNQQELASDVSAVIPGSLQFTPENISCTAPSTDTEMGLSTTSCPELAAQHRTNSKHVKVNIDHLGVLPLPLAASDAVSGCRDDILARHAESGTSQASTVSYQTLNTAPPNTSFCLDGNRPGDVGSLDISDLVRLGGGSNDPLVGLTVSIDGSPSLPSVATLISSNTLITSMLVGESSSTLDTSKINHKVPKCNSKPYISSRHIRSMVHTYGHRQSHISAARAVDDIDAITCELDLIPTKSRKRSGGVVSLVPSKKQNMMGLSGLDLNQEHVESGSREEGRGQKDLTASSGPVTGNSLNTQDPWLCNSCDTFTLRPKSILCPAHHVICQGCLEEEIRAIMASDRMYLCCTAQTCKAAIPVDTLSPVLDRFVLTLLTDNLRLKEQKASEKALKEMRDLVICPSCACPGFMTQWTPNFVCSACNTSCCRYCLRHWTNPEEHDTCYLLSLVGLDCFRDESKLPLTWDPHVHSFNMSFNQQNVPLTTNEGATVAAYFAKTASQDVHITQILRIQNRKLWEKYVLKRKHVCQDIGAADLKEKFLFHGTKAANTVSICSEGFDLRIPTANGAVYGKGIYFATRAKYSGRYTDTSGMIFLARVICGWSEQGNKLMTRPSYESKSRRMFDSCVDDVTRPSIYVIFDNAQCYPEYLIQFANTDT